MRLPRFTAEASPETRTGRPAGLMPAGRLTSVYVRPPARTTNGPAKRRILAASDMSDLGSRTRPQRTFLTTGEISARAPLRQVEAPVGRAPLARVPLDGCNPSTATCINGCQGAWCCFDVPTPPGWVNCRKICDC